MVEPTPYKIDEIFLYANALGSNEIRVSKNIWDYLSSIPFHDDRLICDSNFPDDHFYLPENHRGGVLHIDLIPEISNPKYLIMNGNFLKNN